MAIRSNASGRTDGGTDRTSSEGRKEASGGSSKTPATSGVRGRGSGAGTSTSRGGGSSRSADSKGSSNKAPGRSGVPERKGK
ncbi:hypothetical protein [Flavisolibacter tropicus]|uniref:hypothetical protein n=1 Tax=Flavisolibacter tropicus TaxID=1492898 RepID=UPI0011DFC124|nr:hypothetical protein [Flavisolibacter tropicus]